MKPIQGSRITEGTRVGFKNAQTAQAYSMPPDTVGTVTGWVYVGKGDKRLVVDCDVRQPIYMAWVRECDLVVLR